MYFVMSIHPETIPAWINQSYEPFGFWKFGLGCWVYNLKAPNGTFKDFDGEIEWINTLNFCSSPKLKNPKCFRYCIRGGIKFDVNIITMPVSGIADAIINNIAYNWANGKNLDNLKNI